MASIQKTIFSPVTRAATRSQFGRKTLPTAVPRIFLTHPYIRLASTMALKLKDPSLFKQDVCYVNGEWVKARSGKTFEVNDPATGKLIGTCPDFDAQDTENAIAAADAAFEPFRKTTGRSRSKLLRKWYDLMVENADDLATLITWENGKPMADAKGEVTYAANFFEWFSEEAPRIYGDTIPSSTPGNRVWTIKEPVGVCGLITPWNFPAAMITRKIGPALAVGCTVVCKSPGETPYTSLAIAELAHRAGVPAGVVNVITALDNTPEVGKVLTTNPIVRKVSFTGSTPVGKLLMRQCSSTLKKLSLELGGNAPFIVFDDADVDAAVAGAIVSKFRSSGQTCVCANRIFVQRGVYDEFATKFAAKVRDFTVGNGFDASVTHGPLIHHRAIDKVDQHVRDAESKGATILVGGQKMPDLGPNFFQPTVIGNMTTDMAMASEETFGPVAGLFPFDTEDEVVQIANATAVGLAGYFFSRDLARVYRVAEHLEVGMVGVNTGLISDPASPFGGVKESGFGREGSLYGIGEYQVTKMVTYGGMGLPLQK
ncbi:succinate-semialdehyde dehydrogenase NADP+ [Lasiosphaeria hispida]|uniref:Succinate-semialdehyde dehydrogenase n=1 Tax=Lasiosphaeria hispida TaxID=260671 RepID=A0AAJ0M8C1_9PEZI|nr:succinate-semialdehyde dehydrogenase NADP+ [Lasiosphaeria hispida]